MLMGGVGCLVCNRELLTDDGWWFQWCYGRGGLFVCLFAFVSPRCAYRGWRMKVSNIFFVLQRMPYISLFRYIYEES